MSLLQKNIATIIYCSFKKVESFFIASVNWEGASEFEWTTWMNEKGTSDLEKHKKEQHTTYFCDLCFGYAE